MSLTSSCFLCRDPELSLIKKDSNIRGGKQTLFLIGAVFSNRYRPLTGTFFSFIVGDLNTVTIEYRVNQREEMNVQKCS